MLEKDTYFDNKYKILEQIGRGGTSRVYHVRNVRTNKNWALKEMERYTRNEDGKLSSTLNLLSDVNILKNLNHPNLPTIVDVWEKDLYTYFLEDYIEGKTLLQILYEQPENWEEVNDKDNSKRLVPKGDYDPTRVGFPQETVVEWAKTLCDVFIYLHSQTPKIIYRDCKPSNIMLKPDGTLVLVDFGAAREYKNNRNSGDTVRLGSKGFFAPELEQAGRQTDERTDVFCLGATIYTLLTGMKLNSDTVSIRTYHPELSTGLDKIVMKCVKTAASERFQTMEELKNALSNYTLLDEKTKKKRKFYRIASFLCIIMSVAYLSLSGLFFYQANVEDNKEYNSLLFKAQHSHDSKEQRNYFISAIKLKPDEEEAYFSLLDKYIEDDNFSREEADELLVTLESQSGNSTVEEKFQKSDGYGNFCYRLGMMYYYYFENDGNKPIASAWLSQAAKSKTLPESQKRRSELLSSISSYYLKLNKTSRTGDSEASFADYWYDMNNFISSDISNDDNIKTAYIVYKDFISQVVIHSQDFKKSGIGSTEMKESLDLLASKIEAIEKDEPTAIALTGELKTNLETAYEIIGIEVTNN